MNTRTATQRDRLPDEFQELNQLLPLRPIQDEIDLDNAQEIANRLAVLDSRTADQDAYLETLSLLIESYEDGRHQIETSDLDPIDTLKYLLDQHKTSASELGRIIGQRQLGAKILSRKQGLSKAHILTLSNHFAVSPAVFLKPDAN